LDNIGAIFSSYGVIGLLNLVIDLIGTKTRFRGCRLVRRPVYIRGRKWIRFDIGFTAGRSLRIDAEGSSVTKGSLVVFGRDVQVNDFVHIGAIESIVIGHRVLIASKVFISDHNHGSYGMHGVHTDPRIPPNQRLLSSAPVVIEDDVWIGEFVSILPGAHIGKGSVIGTMSTVIGVIPPYSIAVGSPARVIKQFDFESGKWKRT
jgi:acetyltransferase-like isoleucine patch superfamily enzyme